MKHTKWCFAVASAGTFLTFSVGNAFACSPNSGSYSSHYQANNYSYSIDGNNTGHLTGVLRGQFQLKGSNSGAYQVVQAWASDWYTGSNGGFIGVDYVETAISTPSTTDYLIYGAPTPSISQPDTVNPLIQWALSLVPGTYGALGALAGNWNYSQSSWETTPSSTFVQMKYSPDSNLYTTSTEPSCNENSYDLVVPYHSYNYGDNITSDTDIHYQGSDVYGDVFLDSTGWIRATGPIE